MTNISVVIPTKDRVHALAQTLAGLNGQSSNGDFEVIVVDNGSSDEALAQGRALTAAATIPIKMIEHPSGGPAAARNAGVAASSGAIILFLGDDTEPQDSTLLQAHSDLHDLRPEDSYGVLGRITWDPRRPITPLMRWLENGGPQFAFGEIEAGPVDASNYFYSSHASIKRSLFERIGGFDHRFPNAAIEDTDLGVRLAQAGLKLDYHPELLVLHDHPTSLSQSLDRQITVGCAAALYNRLNVDRPHPKIAPPLGPAWSILRMLMPLIDLAARFPAPAPIRERLWLALHRGRYAQGYRLGYPVSNEV